MTLVWWALALVAFIALVRWIASDARRLDAESWNATRANRDFR